MHGLQCVGPLHPLSLADDADRLVLPSPLIQALLLAIAFALVCLTWGTEASAEGKAASLYIVLVGIPLLEHVLPLRALARELASRGHR